MRINLYSCIAGVDTSGVSTMDNKAILEQDNSSTSYALGIGTNTTLPGMGTLGSWSNKVDASSGSLVAYTPGSFTRGRTNKWVVGVANRTDLRTIGGISMVFAFLFDEAQTKTSLYELTITWSVTIARV
jgi:hypothetical protein